MEIKSCLCIAFNQQIMTASSEVIASTAMQYTTFVQTVGGMSWVVSAVQLKCDSNLDTVATGHRLVY